jgi:hypothetical protein
MSVRRHGRMTHEQRKQDDRDRRAAKKLADAKGAA